MTWNPLFLGFLKVLAYGAAIITVLGGTWLLYMSFFRIIRRNKTVYSYLHYIGGIFVTILALMNVVLLLLAKDMAWIEMIYIGVAMFLNCFFALSVMNLLPKRNTRIHRVFAFATVMGTGIGLSFCFQYASYRYHHHIFLADKISIFICQLLILYGFIVTSLDIIDCILLMIYGDQNPMKLILITDEMYKENLKLEKSMNGIYRVFIKSVVRIFEKRINTKRFDGEEPMTTIKTPVIWLGLLSQMGACVDYTYFNYIIWNNIACTNEYLIGILLRQQFLLGVVPNVFAMFMATLVFRGRLRVTGVVIALTALWLGLAFANLFTHLVIFENHEKYSDISFWFPLTFLCENYMTS